MIQQKVLIVESVMKGKVTERAFVNIHKNDFQQTHVYCSLSEVVDHRFSAPINK
jgi:hypothetical protein